MDLSIVLNILGFIVIAGLVAAIIYQNDKIYHMGEECKAREESRKDYEDMYSRLLVEKDEKYNEMLSKCTANQSI